MSQPTLTLELLNGPLDGHIVPLEGETTWSKEGDGPLTFPWDSELGTPQARFFIEEGKWWLEGYTAPHGTYCTNRGKRIEGKMPLQDGDVLKANETWMLVKQIE